MSSRIRNIDEVSFREFSHGDGFGAELAAVGAELGSRKLGFNVAVVPPGKRAFPFHAHHGNEEMFFILEGKGSMRIGEETHPVRAGDFISLPPGRDSAHQILNDSDAPLRYLAVSTMEVPEVVEYPDSRKLGMITGAPGGRPGAKGDLRHFTRVESEVDYWDREE